MSPWSKTCVNQSSCDIRSAFENRQVLQKVGILKASVVQDLLKERILRGLFLRLARTRLVRVVGSWSFERSLSVFKKAKGSKFALSYRSLRSKRQCHSWSFQSLFSKKVQDVRGFDARLVRFFSRVATFWKSSSGTWHQRDPSGIYVPTLS